MTDEFVMSQWRYYGRILNSGPWHSINLIGGTFATYESEAIKRGLLRWDKLRGAWLPT